MNLPNRTQFLPSDQYLAISNIAVAISFAEGAWRTGSMCNARNNPLNLWKDGRMLRFAKLSEGWHEGMVLIHAWITDQDERVGPSFTWEVIARYYTAQFHPPVEDAPPFAWLTIVCEMLGVAHDSTLRDYITV